MYEFKVGDTVRIKDGQNRSFTATNNPNIIAIITEISWDLHLNLSYARLGGEPVDRQCVWLDEIELAAFKDEDMEYV